ncbi:hypothetical protein N7528_002805 [Penicillium herquei]|nr:hypothetical protein N7528_002805 [Penicillium herquei]
MLERATGYFETAGRRFLRDPNGAIQTRKSLSRQFWKHNIGGDAAHWLLALTQPSDQPYSFVPNPSRRNQSSSDANIPFLDFLYPQKTQEFAASRLSRLSKGVGLRRRKRTIPGLRRTYVSEAISAPQVEQLHSTSSEIAIDEPSKPIEAIKNLWLGLKSRDRSRVHYDNVWVLFLAAGRPAEALSELCAFLSKSNKQVNIDRAWETFLLISEPSDNDFFHITQSQLQLKKPPKLIEICELALKFKRARSVFSLSFLHFIKRYDWPHAQKIWVLRSQLNDEHKGRIISPNWDLRLPSEVVNKLTSYLVRKKDLVENDVRILRNIAEFLLEHLSTSLDMLKDTPMDTLNTIMHNYRSLEISGLQHYVNIIETLQSASVRTDFARSLVFYHQMRLFFHPQLSKHDANFHARKKMLSRQVELLTQFEMPDQVLYFLDEIGHFYGKPSIQNYKDALNLFAHTGDVSQVNLVFDKLLADHGNPKSRRLVTPLLLVHANVGNVSETLNQFRRLQDEFQLQPNTVCWNIVLTAYVTNDDLAGAFSHFSNMVQNGVQLDSHTFGIMMGICANRGDISGVRRLLQQAEEQKVPVTMPMLATVAQAYISGGRIDLAEQLAETSLDSKVEGSPMRMWNSLLMQYAFRIDYRSFKRVWNRMTSVGLTPDATSYTADLLRMALIGSADKARMTLRRLHKQRVFHATEVHYAIVLLAYIKIRNLEMAHVILQEVISRFPNSGLASSLQSFEEEIAPDLKAARQDETNDDANERLKKAEVLLIESIANRDFTALASKLPSTRGRKEALAKSFNTWNHEYLIKQYGANGAMSLARGLFDKYLSSSDATSPQGGESVPAPIRLVTAMMTAHLREDQFEEVDECWQLALSSAIKLASRINVDDLLKPLPSPSAPISDTGSSSPPLPTLSAEEKTQQVSSILLSEQNHDILPARRFTLSRALSVYMRSLAYRNEHERIAQVMHEVNAIGFELTTFNWTTYVQLLADSDKFEHVVEAFRLNETQFMPNWPGWNRLKKGQVFKPPGTPRGVYMLESRNDPEQSKHFLGRAARKYWGNMAPEFLQPTYLTIVCLASALDRIRDASISHGGNEVDVLFSTAPLTVEAISRMPYLRDKFQGVLFRQRSEAPEKQTPKFPRELTVANGGILGPGVRTLRPKVEEFDPLEEDQEDQENQQSEEVPEVPVAQDASEPDAQVAPVTPAIETKQPSKKPKKPREPRRDLRKEADAANAEEWKDILPPEDLIDFQGQTYHARSRRRIPLPLPPKSTRKTKRGHWRTPPQERTAEKDTPPSKDAPNDS